jgi:hypothetical protein
VLEDRVVPSFLGAPANYYVGSNAVAVAQGVFTSDGHLSLVVANDDNPGTVSVLLGNGDGSFQSARTLSVPLYPTAVAVGDFTGDGHLDIVTANPSSFGSVSVLLGNGDGTFQPARNFTVGSYLSSVAVGDFNGDGNLDLIVGDQGNYPFDTGGLKVLLGNGDGTFQAPRSYGARVIPTAIVVGDFNADGNPDAAVLNKGSSSKGGAVSIFLGNGDGSFQKAQNDSVDMNPVAIALGDFNDDGIPDLVTANCYYDGSVSVLLGNGDGSFQPAKNTAVSFIPSGVAVGDFNGDGLPDLLVPITDTSSVDVLLGNGTGFFHLGENYNVGGNPSAAAAGDWNGDGRLDLAVVNQGSSDVSVRLGNGDGSFQTAPTFGPGGAVAVGDFTGSGIPDLVTANPDLGTVNVFLGNGDGTFQAAIPSPDDTQPNFVATGDFNGDGRLSVVTASVFSQFSQNVSILLGNGDGTFQAPRTYSLTQMPSSLVVADFNGDGRPDIAVGTSNADLSQGAVSVLLGNGDGSFGAPITYQTSVAPLGLAVGDFNGDGRPDLVTSYGQVLLGNGDGSFRDGGTYDVGESPSGVTVGDFNGDGILDLAETNDSQFPGSRGVNVLLGNGDGSFQRARNYSGDTAFLGVFTGDFNNDGKLDLAVSGLSGGIGVLLGNGDGSFQDATVNYATGFLGNGYAAGDFNGDGYLDLVSGDVTVLLNAADWPSGGAPRGTGRLPTRKEKTPSEEVDVAAWEASPSPPSTLPVATATPTLPPTALSPSLATVPGNEVVAASDQENDRAMTDSPKREVPGWTDEGGNGDAVRLDLFIVDDEWLRLSNG